MHKSFRLYNNIGGWLVFTIALITYASTVEPTASFWDCGEFIASAYKLEVGHPPGAPLFMLIGRFFSLFAPTLSQVALSINLVSVLASAFTILFLFWTITFFAKKILVRTLVFNTGMLIAVLGSGFIGALAYAFSDSFWFSAVEAEVYASSSLFTAFVFWAILKWESVANKPFANRWLILIAFVMGLSIGVHLLNLLTIPALVFVYYFRKHKISVKGILASSGISIAILAFIMYGIIPQAVNLAAQFDLFFVNSLGFDFGTGVFFYLFALAGILIFGIYYSHKTNKPVLNTLILGVLVILIGYSSFTVIVIRSQANTPMNENQPDNVFSLLSYLNREQYGNRPLFSGPYYDSQYKRDGDGNTITDPKYSYLKGKDKYIKTQTGTTGYQYADGETTLFPRMYSRNGIHISGYKSWGSVQKRTRPSFVNNIRFFIKYQIGQMYFRYFMWNFSGKQNDKQGLGGITKGNWITGISFIDSIMLGNQSQLQDYKKQNKTRNKYFMLPLILGLIGFTYTFLRSEKTFVIISLLFFFTGIAIVIYLNQTPYQARERDYAYVGSFYAFAIWIGLGTTALFNQIRKLTNDKSSAIITTLVAASIPLIMGMQNYDDHNRSNRYTTTDFAKNYLNSCSPNAILFTYGDNDTFPLWYVQETEGFRTDVKVVNLSLLGTDWYINQMCRKAYESEPVPFKMPPEKYRKGNRDVLFLRNTPSLFLNEKFFAYKEKFATKYDSLYNELLAVLAASEYPAKAATDYNLLQTKQQVLSPQQLIELAQTMAKTPQISRFNFDKTAISDLLNHTNTFATELEKCNLPLKDAMDFAASDEKGTKLSAGTSEEANFLPATHFTIPVSASSLKAFNLSKTETQKAVNTIDFTLNRSYIYKDKMAVLEILARNNWNRPIYFASSVGTNNFFGLSDYFRLEGFAYRLIPVKNTQKNTTGSVNTEILYQNLMNFSWGNIKNPDVLIEHNNLRVMSIMEIRKPFARLASALITEGKKSKAIEVLNRCMEEIPAQQVPLDKTIIPIVENYFKANAPEKAIQIIKQSLNRQLQDIRWYTSLGNDMQYYILNQKDKTAEILNEFQEFAEKYHQKELYLELSNAIAALPTEK